jgi:hypothetical protein
VLVRDFRDVLCSTLAFSEKRGGGRLGRQRVDTDLEFVGIMQERAERLVAAWEESREHAHLVRYEDLITDPHPVVEALLAHLELDSSRALVDAMVASLSAETGLEERHRTTPDAVASIGRWREDLPPELREAALEALAPSLAAFEYD